VCRARKLGVADVGHWTGIPAIPTGAFKDFDFTCLPAEERTTVFHSSGTTRQRPSRHFHSTDSLALYRAAARRWFQRHLPPTDPPRVLLSLTPPVDRAPNSSLVRMLDFVSDDLAPDRQWFAGATADGFWTLDPAAVTTQIEAAGRSRRPVLLAGTAFNFVHLLDWMDANGVRTQLPSGSAVMETGGYKGRSREVPKTRLHESITGRLGVPAGRIVCEYGMCELSSQAYDRVAGDKVATRRFRLPPWARGRIVSPEDGREVAINSTGVLQVFDLANVFSVLAVQTEDLAVRRADGWELLGRTTTAEPRGCSLLPQSF
jgi:hypothetical protein